MKSEIQVRPYESWMRPQVVALFCASYGGHPETVAHRFDRVFEHPFQKDRSIRFVAIDREKVVGFQSYVYWPYCFDGNQLSSFQSGASLVAPDYRGRGVFSRLLNIRPEESHREQIDFLMGFPVEMSFGSFLRNGWENPLDLGWHGRILRPLAILSRFDLSRVQIGLDESPEPIDAAYPNRAFALSRCNEFNEWRRQIQTEPLYRYFHYSGRRGKLRFDLKLNQRGRIIELILGNILATATDEELYNDGLRALINAARKFRFLAFMSIALNRSFQDQTLLSCLRKNMFFRLKPKIHFIVKGVASRPDGFNSAAHWSLFRADIDTW